MTYCKQNYYNNSNHNDDNHLHTNKSALLANDKEHWQLNIGQKQRHESIMSNHCNMQFQNKTSQNAALMSGLTTLINNLLIAQDQVTIALSGGKSPIELFNLLSTSEINWQKITITLVDERLIPISHHDSNAYLIKRNLLINNAKNANFIPIVSKESLLSKDLNTNPNTDTDINIDTTIAINVNNDINDTDVDIQNILTQINQNVKHIDIAILGMGDDGHIASIFQTASNAEQLLDLTPTANKYNYTNPNNQNIQYKRISLNLYTIINIPFLFLNIYGATKQQVIKESFSRLDKNSLVLPIDYVLKSRHDIKIYSSI